jgi:hypothetical protein
VLGRRGAADETLAEPELCQQLRSHSRVGWLLQRTPDIGGAAFGRSAGARIARCRAKDLHHTGIAIGGRDEQVRGDALRFRAGVREQRCGAPVTAAAFERGRIGIDRCPHDRVYERELGLRAPRERTVARSPGIPSCSA